jgi:hypothetical protein
MGRECLPMGEEELENRAVPVEPDQSFLLIEGAEVPRKYRRCPIVSLLLIEMWFAVWSWHGRRGSTKPSSASHVTDGLVKSVSNEGKHDRCECGVLNWVVSRGFEITCGGMMLELVMLKKERGEAAL